MIGFGMLKGMRVTLKNALKKPSTIQYPDRRVGPLGAAQALETNVFGLLVKHPGTAIKSMLGVHRIKVNVPQNERFRGNEFTWFEDRCTGCASCAKYCPLGIIEIVTSPGGIDVKEGESYAIDVFDIDIGRCMFCGLCVEACPYDALHMGSKFERARYERGSLVIPVDELRAAEKRPSSWFRPQFEERGYSAFDSDEVEDHYEAGRHERPTDDELKQRWVTER